MPRRTHWNDHTLPIGSDTTFTNLRAGRSRQGFPIQRPTNSNRLIIAAVVFMVLVCGAIFFLTESMRVDENRDCIASAYQATQNGFDLEANL